MDDLYNNHYSIKLFFNITMTFGNVHNGYSSYVFIQLTNKLYTFSYPISWASINLKKSTPCRLKTKLKIPQPLIVYTSN